MWPFSLNRVERNTSDQPSWLRCSLESVRLLPWVRARDTQQSVTGVSAVCLFVCQIRLGCTGFAQQINLGLGYLFSNCIFNNTDSSSSGVFPCEAITAPLFSARGAEVLDTPPLLELRVAVAGREREGARARLLDRSSIATHRHTHTLTTHPTPCQIQLAAASLPQRLFRSSRGVLVGQLQRACPALE